MSSLIKRTIGKQSHMEMKAGAKSADIYIYDAVGPSQYGLVSGKEVSAAVREAGAVDELHVYVASPGGSVFEAMAIYNTFKDHKAKVIMHVTYAASAATFFAMSGDEIEMAENGIWMVHPPRTFTEGTVEELQSDVQALIKIRQQVNETYAARTKLPLSEVESLVQATTWMTASEAKSKGFVDRVTPNKSVSAHIDLSAYSNVPAWCQQTLPTLITEKKMTDPVVTPPTLPTPNAKGETLFTADQLDAFMKSVQASAKGPTPPVAPVVSPPPPPATPPTPQQNSGMMSAEQVQQLVNTAVQASNQRVLEITALCTQCGVPSMAAKFINDPKVTVHHVQQEMITVLVAKNTTAGNLPGNPTENGGNTADPQAKFKQEYAANKDVFMAQGITEDDYVKSQEWANAK